MGHTSMNEGVTPALSTQEAAFASGSTVLHPGVTDRVLRLLEGQIGQCAQQDVARIPSSTGCVCTSLISMPLSDGVRKLLFQTRNTLERLEHVAAT